MRKFLLCGFLSLFCESALAAKPAQVKYWVVTATLSCKACEQDGRILIAGNQPAQYITAKSQCEFRKEELISAVKKAVKNKKLKIKAACKETKNPAAEQVE